MKETSGLTDMEGLPRWPDGERDRERERERERALKGSLGAQITHCVRR